MRGIYTSHCAIIVSIGAIEQPFAPEMAEIDPLYGIPIR